MYSGNLGKGRLKKQRISKPEPASANPKPSDSTTQTPDQGPAGLTRRPTVRLPQKRMNEDPLIVSPEKTHRTLEPRPDLRRSGFPGRLYIDNTDIAMGNTDEAIAPKKLVLRQGSSFDWHSSEDETVEVVTTRPWRL